MAAPEASEQHDVPGITARQRANRVTTLDLGASPTARLLPGGDVDVLNVSESGLLVEGKSRPVIGTVVSIRLKGSRVKRLEGRIVRSRVSTIHRDGTLSYESAIEFNHPHAVEDLVNADGDSTPALSTDDAIANPSSDGEAYIIDTDNDW